MANKIKLRDTYRDIFLNNPAVTNLNFSKMEISYAEGVAKQKFAFRVNEGEGLILDQTNNIEYHRVTIESPMDVSRFRDGEYPPQTNFYKIETNYNYPALEYFNFFKDIEEINMPSIYLSSRAFFNEEEMEMYSTFGANLTPKKVMNFDADLSSLYEPVGSLFNKYSNFFFGIDFDFGIGNTYHSDLPWYNRITFSTAKNTKLLNLLNTEQVKLRDKVIGDFRKAPKDITTFMIGTEGNQVEYETLDLSELISKRSYSFSKEDMVFFGKHYEPNSLTEAVNRWAALSSLMPSALDSMRSMDEIYLDQDCEYEFLFYKVEKYFGNGTVGGPIQTFIISNTSEITNLLDSQIKPLQVYTYKVTACALIHGCKYTYNVIDERVEEGQRVIKAEVQMAPSLKLVEIPFFEERIHITKSPPLPPFVQFMNKSNIKNKIRIYLSLQRGSHTTGFTSMKATDIDKSVFMEGMLTAKPIKFEYSKDPGKFEVFRLRRNGDSYEVITDYIVENRKGHPHVVFQEKVTPNKKYYYQFRSISAFGLPSNPSPIYEIELIRDADSSRIAVNIVEPREKPLFEPDVKFKQFLHIHPAYHQMSLADPEDFDFETYKNSLRHINIGPGRAESVWGRKFKIRVTSNNTGRKIDFNLIFDIVKKETNEI